MKTITITGGDPGNPRNTAHILERLEQIKRDAGAMRDEVARLHVYAGSIRDVLMSQGRSENEAGATAQEIQGRISSLDADLDAVGDSATRAIDGIWSSKVILSARFEWKPTR